VKPNVTDMRSQLQRLKAKARALFPNHQIYFRTDGKVRFFTLTTGMQLTAVGIACLTFLWVGKSTYEYVAQGTRLQANRVALSKMSGKMEALSDDIQGLEQRILERAATLEARQNALQSVLVEGLGEIAPLDLQTLTDDALSTDVQTTTLKREEEAKAFLKRKPGESAFKHYDGVFDILEARQTAFVAELLEQTALEKQNIHAMLSGLNVDPDTFEQVALADGADAPVSAIGGPEISLADLNAEDETEPFGELMAEWTRLQTLRAQILSVPAIAPLNDYYISSKYGRRRDPFTRRWAHHAGVDLAAWYGSPVHATSSGKVTYAGYKSGYGRVVEVNHGNGFVTRYGHLRKIVVKKGQDVTMTTKLGETGSTGRSTGPHVHYEIWFNGKTVNPVPFIKASNDVLKIQGRSTRG